MKEEITATDRGGLRLLLNSRFWPLFWTQFLGALNDNLFKNALVILITYRAYRVAGLAPEQVVALCGGIFILPFFLFSALAGQIADKVSKSRLMRWIKAWEILVMTLAGIGFMTGSFPLLIATLFLMGLQSSFFGPAKYACLPELLDNSELVSGNAYVEMGTFLAILLGTLAGGLLIAVPQSGGVLVAGAVLLTSLAGWVTSLKIRPLDPAFPGQKISFNFVRSTIAIVGIARRTRSIFLSILGISWFWLVGAVILSILPAYCKDTLGAGERVVTFFLALFSLGVGIGSLVCEKLSFRQLELGLVPIGSFGLTVFALDLFLVGRPELGAAPGQLVTITGLLGTLAGWRIVVDLLLFSLFGGFFIVPLYTLIQQRAEPTVRSQTIAANNIINALFMVAGALLLTLLFSLGATIPMIFLVLALLNLAVAVYIYTLLPEFLYRMICWVLAHALYRLRVTGRAHIPLEGPAVLVCNHVTFVDWLILAGATQRPVRFVMHYSFLKVPFTGRIFRDAKVIPIAGSREDHKILDEAFVRISEELRAGEVVGIFPEGHLTADGEIDGFRNGIERIIGRDPVPVVPMALKGLWGSKFSRWHLSGQPKPPRDWWRAPTRLNIGEPVAAESATAAELERAVRELYDRAQKGE